MRYGASIIARQRRQRSISAVPPGCNTSVLSQCFHRSCQRRQEHRTGNPKGYPTTRKCRVFGHPYLMFLYVVSWLQLVDGVPPERALASTP
jgi:hypothetical protein